MGVPILWRSRRQRYSLEGEMCPACERAVFPPRQVCPYCSRTRVEDAHSEDVYIENISTEKVHAGNPCAANGQGTAGAAPRSTVTFPALQIEKQGSSGHDALFWMSQDMNRSLREAGDD